MTLDPGNQPLHRAQFHPNSIWQKRFINLSSTIANPARSSLEYPNSAGRLTVALCAHGWTGRCLILVSAAGATCTDRQYL